MTPTEVTEAMVEALKPFACIADSEPNTPDGASTMVKISRCRDARAALDKFEATAPTGDGEAKWLGELLATIHRDGGHYQATHGTEKAVADAHAIIAGDGVPGMVLVPREDLRRALVLLRLPTVRQVINAGDDAIDAAGLNPWAMNEGLATGDERISPSFIDDWRAMLSTTAGEPK